MMECLSQCNIDAWRPVNPNPASLPSAKRRTGRQPRGSRVRTNSSRCIPTPPSSIARSGNCTNCRRWSRRGRSCAQDAAREAAAAVAFCCRAAIAPRASTTALAPIAPKLKILLQMSLVLVHGTRKPVIRIGRIAGQYAKPRSADIETRGDVTLPAIAATSSTAIRFTAPKREPDPDADAARLRARGADAQLHPRADRRRLRRPAPPRVLGRLVREHRRAGRIPADRRVDPRVARLRRRDHRRRERGRCAASTSTQPRGARAAVRAGADAPGAAPARLVQPVDALPVDRHAHRAARRRARRVLPRHPQSDRHQDRPGDDDRLAAAPARRARSRPRARPDHADPADGRRARSSRSCRRWSRRVRGAGRTAAVDCDPMHGNTETLGKASRRAGSTRSSTSSSRASSSTRSSARGSAACTSSSPARTSPSASAARAASRGRPRARLQEPSIRASTTSRRSSWRCGSRASAAVWSPPTDRLPSSPRKRGPAPRTMQACSTNNFE